MLMQESKKAGLLFHPFGSGLFSSALGHFIPHGVASFFHQMRGRKIPHQQRRRDSVRDAGHEVRSP